jgi:hypothetical protein
MKRKGWQRESARHALAARGIKTTLPLVRLTTLQGKNLHPDIKKDVGLPEWRKFAEALDNIPKDPLKSGWYESQARIFFSFTPAYQKMAMEHLDLDMVVYLQKDDQEGYSKVHEFKNILLGKPPGTKEEPFLDTRKYLKEAEGIYKAYKARAISTNELGDRIEKLDHHFSDYDLTRAIHHRDSPKVIQESARRIEEIIMGIGSDLYYDEYVGKGDPI